MAEHNGDIKGYVPKKNTTQNKLLDEKDEAQQAVENRARMVQMYKDNATVEALPQGSTARAKKELELSKTRRKAATDGETATETAEKLKSTALAQKQVATEKEARVAAEVGKPLDSTPEGLAARYEAKRLEAEIADKDFKAADELEETPENYYLLQARSLERDKELRELKELAGVADAEPVFDEDTPEFKAYSAKVDAFNAVADDDKVADEVKDKLEAEMNAAEKEVFPLYAPANTSVERASTVESEADAPAPIATPATVKPATVASTTATTTAESEAEASKFSRTATGVADNKGNFINGDKEAARAALSRNDAYPTADKDYLDNRLMNGTLTPAEYAKQLKAKPTPSKGGTFSVMSTTVADKAPEAPAAAPDPYAAIIQQLTNQMNNTGQDFASRRKAVTAKAALKDVLAQREQSMDRAQRETQAMREAAARETQAMREAAVRATEFDYRKGRDVTGDARYEAEKARLYGNDDLDRKERAGDKRYERLQHAKEWLALNENQRAQLQNQKVAALRSRLSDTDMYGEDTADLWGLQDE